jgi:lincosamide nucleotidyltransferase B/F
VLRFLESIIVDKVTQLLARLDAIGQSLSKTDQALALLGLGSVGAERDRLDAYSDLDFWVIVRPGAKQRFLQNLDWLSAIHPLAYAFLNTADGYKALYADGIFCEFAIFEPQELSAVPFTGGRIVWKAQDFDESISTPTPRQRTEPTMEWLVGEALTNLYVGLGRWHRGEKLSATYFIQVYAVGRILDLAKHLETAQPAHIDPFSPERRFEVRYPTVAAQLPAFMQGYDRNIESARAILTFLKARFEVNAAMESAIVKLC